MDEQILIYAAILVAVISDHRRDFKVVTASARATRYW